MMNNIRHCLHNAAQQLAVITDVPELEAEILLSYCLQRTRAYLHAWPEREISDPELNSFKKHLTRRLQQEPIAYITGSKEFWSLELEVNRHTLIPRPETELIIETVLSIFPKQQAINIADLGTGSGAIALSLASEYPTSEIYATDISVQALKTAERNAKRLNLQNVLFHQGHWCEALPRKDFDIIVSNPPYIAKKDWPSHKNSLRFEPENALISGNDGLDAICTIAQQARKYLISGGYIIVEHGYDQAEAVRHIFLDLHYKPLNPKYDLCGHSRLFLAQFF
jgi:release factor glutamine methyltransferase